MNRSVALANNLDIEDKVISRIRNGNFLGLFEIIVECFVAMTGIIPDVIPVGII